MNIIKETFEEIIALLQQKPTSPVPTPRQDTGESKPVPLQAIMEQGKQEAAALQAQIQAAVPPPRPEGARERFERTQQQKNYRKRISLVSTQLLPTVEATRQSDQFKSLNPAGYSYSGVFLPDVTPSSLAYAALQKNLKQFPRKYADAICIHASRIPDMRAEFELMHPGVPFANYYLYAKSPAAVQKIPLLIVTTLEDLPEWVRKEVKAFSPDMAICLNLD